MSDWMDDLGALEDKLEKIKQIAEQEKAMQAVLPLRFSANMQAFERLIPAIFNKFKDYKVTRELEFFCTENGEPNIRWKDNGHAFMARIRLRTVNAKSNTPSMPRRLCSLNAIMNMMLSARNILYFLIS